MSGGPCAVSEQANEWAVLDDLLGVETVNAPDNGVGALAFYGRCSTEDNQDPETSRGWQISNARKFVEPLGGGVSRSSSTLASRVRCRGSGAARSRGCSPS